MAKNEELELLLRGVDAWNDWRANTPELKPDLSMADLRGAHLPKANFFRTNLHGANLLGASLTGANFRAANLSNAYLIGAHLMGAALSGANLSWTDMFRADLQSANFFGAILTHTNLTEAKLGYTIFANSDLRTVRGLDTITHRGPSAISIEAVYLSNGSIPENFLRGVGVPDDFITFMRSLTGQAIEFYSCFISYSSKNHEFAERLHADLQDKGVRCWFAPEDLKIGDRIRLRIDESIRLHDKLLLVLSEESVKSQWVEQEVETALAREREQNRIVLFPIRLDESVMGVNSGWPWLIKNTRHIGDFSLWKDHDSYKDAFARLIRDLKAED